MAAIAIMCVTAAWFFIRWNFANAVASRIDLTRPEAKPVVDWLIGMAPSDPQTHYAAAALFEKTFDPADLARSLREYELAAAFSPYNYVTWVNLGQTRNLHGDAGGAEAAYARALQLAPNYAAVQWAAGNFLIREGRTDEGFALAARAAASNPDYSRSAVVTALQIFEGDLAAVRNALGDTETTNAALAAALVGQERFDEAFETWSKLDSGKNPAEFRKFGENLVEQMVSAKKFRLAARITAGLRQNDADKPLVGQIANGSFETDIKLRGAYIFEWQIGAGAEPQIGRSETQKRTGGYGLSILFNSFEASDFRPVSQTVAVEPDSQYEFEAFYRSDLKTTATLKWEIADAAGSAVIAATQPFELAGDWATLTVRFTVPVGVDGILIRLVREGCVGPACRVIGRLSFDDLSIKRL